MDFEFTPKEQAVRQEGRARRRAHPPRAWQRALYEGGWVGLHWPVKYGGRGVSLVEQIIFYEELARAQAPPPVNRGGLSMLGPTLMAHGTEAQVQRFLPKILTAEEIWCQGF